MEASQAGSLRGACGRALHRRHGLACGGGAEVPAAPSVAKQITSCMPAVAGDELFSVYKKLTPATFGAIRNDE